MTLLKLANELDATKRPTYPNVPPEVNLGITKGDRAKAGGQVGALLGTSAGGLAGAAGVAFGSMGSKVKKIPLAAGTVAGAVAGNLGGRAGGKVLGGAIHSVAERGSDADDTNYSVKDEIKAHKKSGIATALASSAVGVGTGLAVNKLAKRKFSPFSSNIQTKSGDYVYDGMAPKYFDAGIEGGITAGTFAGAGTMLFGLGTESTAARIRNARIKGTRDFNDETQ